MLKNLYNIGTHTESAQKVALKHLGDPENASVLEFLRSKLIERTETLKKAKSLEDVYRYQGRIAELEDLLETIATLNGETS